MLNTQIQSYQAEPDFLALAVEVIEQGFVIVPTDQGRRVARELEALGYCSTMTDCDGQKRVELEE